MSTMISLSLRPRRRIGPPRPPEPAESTLTLSLVAVTLATAIPAVGVARLGWSLSPATWYVTRAAGLTLYVTLWATVMLGLALTTPLFARFRAGATVHSLHRYLSSLGLAALVLHLASLGLDQTVAFGIRALLVPFAAGWREPWTAIGVFALYGYILISASSAVRWFLGARGWRLVHWLSFPLYGMALAHGIGAGSDSHSLWAQSLYLVTATAVLWAAGMRLLLGRRRGRVLDVEPAAATFDRMASPARGR
jgi:predicted ferric reductase